MVGGCLFVFEEGGGGVAPEACAKGLQGLLLAAGGVCAVLCAIWVAGARLHLASRSDAGGGV